MVRTAMGHDADHTGCGLNAVVNSIPHIETMPYRPLKHPSVLGKAYIFRTNSNNAISFRNSRLIRERNGSILDKGPITPHRSRYEIDKTNKISHHLIGRMGIDIKRASNLLDFATIHDDNAITHGHGF